MFNFIAVAFIVGQTRDDYSESPLYWLRSLAEHEIIHIVKRIGEISMLIEFAWEGVADTLMPGTRNYTYEDLDKYALKAVEFFAALVSTLIAKYNMKLKISDILETLDFEIVAES